MSEWLWKLSALICISCQAGKGQGHLKINVLVSEEEIMY